MAPSLSADGRYLATRDTNLDQVVVKRQSDGSELFRIVNEGRGLARLQPTFSQNSEFIATHSIIQNSNEGTSGLQERLIVHQCGTGKKICEANLSLHPEVISFSKEWIIVAGESRRHGSKCSCQVLRSDDGSEVGTLIIPTASLPSYWSLERDDTYLYIHLINAYEGGSSFFGLPSQKSRVTNTYRWNWSRVLELSQQGENIIAVGPRLGLFYNRNNDRVDARAELTRLGAQVAPYRVRVEPGNERGGVTYKLSWDEGTDERYLGVDDPSGGLSINLSELSLSDGEIIRLLKRIPNIKEIRFAHFQLIDLSQLSQIRGLEKIVTRRTMRTSDFAAMANLVALKGLPVEVQDDDTLVHVSKMKALESISLAGKKVTDVGIEYLLELKKLRRLVLHETSISNQALLRLSRIPSLTELDVTSCAKLTDTALLHLQNFKTLQRLSLSYAGSDITKEGVAELRRRRPDLKVSTGDDF